MELNNSMKIVLDDILKGKKRVALGGHVRPDGDCVGSCMGLYHYLREQYPDIATDVYLEEVPEAYRIIKGTDEVKDTDDDSACMICSSVWTAGTHSVSGFQGLCLNMQKRRCASTIISAMMHLQTITISCRTPVLLQSLYIHVLDKEKISLASAEALYMGIVHDTGVFQYSCTSPETMEIAADLMRKGINGSEIIDKTYYEKTYIQNQILGRALLESMLIMDKKCIVSVIRQKSMKFFQAKPSDLEGIVSQLRQTKGVEVAIFLHEISPQKFKVSLRSKGKVDVSEIAKYYRRRRTCPCSRCDDGGIQP